MGACSSKPKTTEFEGSTGPSKETPNETGKEEERATDADAEAVQKTRELIASKDEAPLIKGLPNTEEGFSHNVKAEEDTIDGGEAGNSATEKGKADAGDVEKVDVGVGATDMKEASDKVTTVDKGVRGDQDKLFEDKAVVLDEAGIGGVGMGDTYVDKKVAADEEKAQDNGSVTTQDAQSRNLQDINEFPGAESPIIGVIQSADPIHVDDVSESVGLATLETPAHVDSTVIESPVEIERDVSTGTNIGEDGIEAANLSSGSPQEAPEEKEGVLHDNSKGSPLPVTISDDGVGQERGAKDAGDEEVPLASADVQDETSVKDTSKPETIEDPQNDIDERTPEPQEENGLEKSARESHPEVTENEGSAEVVNETKPEALEVVDAETSTEPETETALEEANEGQDVGIVGEPNVSDVKPQTLPIEEPNEDGKPEATPDEAVAEPSAETEREEKVEEPHIEEAATNEEKVERVDAENHESSAGQPKSAPGEGNLEFEDASDVPLKVESSTIESGGIPSS